MIRLEVAEYCSECEAFTASVEPPSKMLGENGTVVLQTDTIVSCASRKRCEAIKRYLERSLDPYTRT